MLKALNRNERQITKFFHTFDQFERTQRPFYILHIPKRPVRIRYAPSLSINQIANSVFLATLSIVHHATADILHDRPYMAFVACLQNKMEHNELNGL